MHYSVQQRDRIFEKDSGKKYAQKRLDHAKQSVIDAIKTSSKTVIQKTAEATGNLISNKNAKRITKVSKNFPQNNSETVTNKHDEEISG